MISGKREGAKIGAGYKRKKARLSNGPVRSALRRTLPELKLNCPGGPIRDAMAIWHAIATRKKTK